MTYWMLRKNSLLTVLVLVGTSLKAHGQSVIWGQDLEVSAEMYQAACTMWLPSILERPRPGWVRIEGSYSDQVLDAVTVDGVTLPYFPLDSFLQVEFAGPSTTSVMFGNGDDDIVQAFGQFPVDTSPIIGKEHVEAGLVDKPINVVEFDRRRMNFDVEDIDCAEDLSSASSRYIFQRYLDLLAAFLSSPIFDKMIDVGSDDDYIQLWGNSFTFNRFSESGTVYSYTYGAHSDEEFESSLNSYIWALQNHQYNIVQHDAIEAALTYVMTPEDEEDEALQNARFWDFLISLPQREEGTTPSVTTPPQ